MRQIRPEGEKERLGRIKPCKNSDWKVKKCGIAPHFFLCSKSVCAPKVPDPFGAESPQKIDGDHTEGQENYFPHMDAEGKFH